MFVVTHFKSKLMRGALFKPSTGTEDPVPPLSASLTARGSNTDGV